MSAIHLARQAYSAFAGEKPRVRWNDRGSKHRLVADTRHDCLYQSSITEWIEILTSNNYDEEAYDGCVYFIFDSSFLECLNMVVCY